MAESLDLMRGFVCGGISGWAQVFVMQPFEIIKVRLVNQSLLNPEYLGILHCFKRILKEEGLRSFYKGSCLFIQALSPPSLDTAFRDLWPSGQTNSSNKPSPTMRERVGVCKLVSCR
jgi:hypothetical protein